MNKQFLDDAIKQFSYYKMLGEKTFEQLEEQDYFWQYHDESNSIAIIVQHLCGNMLSRWTNFLVEDGEKPWRNRDAEFEKKIFTSKDLLIKWDEGWNCVFEALKLIKPGNYDQIIYIRNMGHSIDAAIIRQLNHYSYHIGQIVYIGRMRKGSKWVNLSISKGKSERYNQNKFSKPRRNEHFTDDL